MQLIVARMDPFIHSLAPAQYPTAYQSIHQSITVNTPRWTETIVICPSHAQSTLQSYSIPTDLPLKSRRQKNKHLLPVKSEINGATQGPSIPSSCMHVIHTMKIQKLSTKHALAWLEKKAKVTENPKHHGTDRLEPRRNNRQLNYKHHPFTLPQSLSKTARGVLSYVASEWTDRVWK